MSKIFTRGYYSSLTSSSKRDKPNLVSIDLFGFAVGVLHGHYGYASLQEALHEAVFGSALDTYTRYDFLFTRNLNQKDSITDIYAIPRTNERKRTPSSMAVWALSHTELEKEQEIFFKAHPVICTFIEGWIAGSMRR